MAKKIISSEDNLRTFLIKSREDFSKELNDRILIGKEMIDRDIENQVDLNKLSRDFADWHDFNAELIKRAFNKTDNEYLKSYLHVKRTGVRFISLGAGPSESVTLSSLINKKKNEIHKYLRRIEKLYQKIELIDCMSSIEPHADDENTLSIALRNLETIFKKFHRVAKHLRRRHNGRETIVIRDEYDVQDLLRSLLHLYFDDIREEEYSPSYAGANSRIDFILKNEKIVIETKMTNERLTDKKIGDQLLIDIGRYKEHPDCATLILFIYDKGDLVVNKKGMINDLDNLSHHGLMIKTFIEPE